MRGCASRAASQIRRPTLKSGLPVLPTTSPVQGLSQLRKEMLKLLKAGLVIRTCGFALIPQRAAFTTKNTSNKMHVMDRKPLPYSRVTVPQPASRTSLHRCLPSCRLWLSPPSPVTASLSLSRAPSTESFPPSPRASLPSSPRDSAAGALLLARPVGGGGTSPSHCPAIGQPPTGVYFLRD